MRTAVGLIFGLLPVAAWAAEQAPPDVPAPVRVLLRPDVAGVTARVTVGDVATVEDGTPDLRRQIAGLDLDTLPTAGGSVITAKQVAYRIALAGVPPASFRVGGAGQVHVRQGGGPTLDPAVRQAGHTAQSAVIAAGRRRVDEDAIFDAARTALLGRIPWAAADVLIRPAQPVAGAFVAAGPADEIRLAAEVAAPPTGPGRAPVVVRCSVNGTPAARVPVMLEVLLYQQVLVTTRRVERGEPLGEANCHIDRRPVDRLDRWLGTADGLKGQRAKRTLAPGEPLAAADVEAIPASDPVVMKQRTVVQLVARVGPVRVTALGEALQDGHARQVIRVRNTDSNNVVLGRVVDRSTVEVDY